MWEKLVAKIKKIPNAQAPRMVRLSAKLIALILLTALVFGDVLIVLSFARPPDGGLM